MNSTKTMYDEVSKMGALLYINYITDKINNHDYNDEIVKKADIHKRELAKQKYEEE